jgi:hypothetical protein
VALATVTCLALAYSTSPEKRVYHENTLQIETIAFGWKDYV